VFFDASDELDGVLEELDVDDGSTVFTTTLVFSTPEVDIVVAEDVEDVVDDDDVDSDVDRVDVVDEVDVDEVD